MALFLLPGHTALSPFRVDAYLSVLSDAGFEDATLETRWVYLLSVAAKPEGETLARICTLLDF